MKIHRFDYTSIKSKLIVAYILLAIIPIIIITMVSNIVYSKSIQKQVDALLEYSMNQAGKILNDNIKDYESLIYNIVLDKEVLNYSQKIQQKSNAPVNKYFLTQKLISYGNIKEEIRNIIFISDSLDYAIYEKDNFVSYESYFYDLDVRKEFLSNSINEEGVTLISTQNIKARPDKEVHMFFLAMPIKDYITQKRAGVLFVGIRESTLVTLTDQKQDLNNDYDDILNSKNIIIDQDNTIVSHQDKHYLGERISKFIGDHNISNLFIKEKEIVGTPWRLVNIIDKNDMLKDVKSYSILVLLISIIITALFFLLIAAITNKYSNSIQQISKGIRSFGQGNMDIKIEVEKKDELFAIAHQFNKMTTRINNLVNTLEKQKKDIKIAVDQKRKSELKALESQINPHFIYNTLDVINWTAIDNNQERISEMLSTLGSLLRYSISNIDIIVILEAEVQWIKKYIYLQKIRFNNSFECFYDISEEASQFPIHKLLLQPIIENAIIHGFEGVKSGGIIRVSAYINKDNILCVEISDNGQGMNEDIVKQLKEYINNNSLFDGNNIGIKNIINRVNLYYLGTAQIEIYSKEGKGTTIKLKLPYKTN